MLRPNHRSHTLPHNNNGNGYGGYGGGGGAGIALGYGGSFSSNDSSSYKDKPRKRRTIIPNLEPWMIAAGVAVFFCFLTFYFNSQKSALSKQLQSKLDELANLKTDLTRVERDLKKSEMTERAMKKKQESAEMQNRQFLKERDELRIKYEGPERKEEEKREAARIEGYKTMLKQLQQAIQQESKRAVVEKFGPGPHRVKVSFTLPPHLVEEAMFFVIEMAPLDSMPHSVKLFLEQVDHDLWNNAWFYVNGPHVLQCGPQAEEEQMEEFPEMDERQIALRPFTDLKLESLAFPEYSQDYPHVPWTLGFTGRPGGPDWYINKVDNTVAHGPGGQEHHDLDEFADPCFAKVVEGFDALETVFQLPNVKGGTYQYFLEAPVHVIKMEIIGRNKIPASSPSVAAEEEDTTTSDSEAAAKQISSISPKSQEMTPRDESKNIFQDRGKELDKDFYDFEPPVEEVKEASQNETAPKNTTGSSSNSIAPPEEDATKASNPSVADVKVSTSTAAATGVEVDRAGSSSAASSLQDSKEDELTKESLKLEETAAETESNQQREAEVGGDNTVEVSAKRRKPLMMAKFDHMVEP